MFCPIQEFAKNTYKHKHFPQPDLHGLASEDSQETADWLPFLTLTKVSTAEKNAKNIAQRTN